MYRIGAKVSLFTMSVCEGIRTIVGSTNCGPISGRRRPPKSTWPPSASACFNALNMSSTASAVIRWTHQYGRIQRISDPHLSIRVHQPLDKFLRDALVNDDAPCRCASLACRADRSKQDGACCQIKICVLCDNDRVVAAKLQNRASESSCNGLRYMLPNRR